jgi:hypothetical protein
MVSYAGSRACSIDGTSATRSAIRTAIDRDSVADLCQGRFRRGA